MERPHIIVGSTLTGEPRWERLTMRHKYKWEDNIKTDFREMVCKDMNQIELVQTERDILKDLGRNGSC
jgi:hypothetical protein